MQFYHQETCLGMEPGDGFPGDGAIGNLHTFPAERYATKLDCISCEDIRFHFWPDQRVKSGFYDFDQFR